MRCKNSEEAMRGAKANADANGEIWCVFTDASGGWNCERYKGQVLNSWSGVRYDLVQPDRLKSRFIVRINSEQECWDVLDLRSMTTQGDDAEPEHVMSIHGEFWVKPTVTWLNRCWETWLLANDTGPIIEPGVERPFEIKRRGPGNG